MTEQPPPSAEAMRLAGGAPNPIGLATAIDALCEQRVSAETARAQSVINAARIMCEEYGEPDEWMSASDLRQAVIAYDKAIAPAERPVPPQQPDFAKMQEMQRRAHLPRRIGVEQPAQETDSPVGGTTGLPQRPAYFTYDPAHGGAYYFAPNDRTCPPYLEQREVTAILDVASDGTLAGVELVWGDLPVPPPSALASTGEQPDCGEAVLVARKKLLTQIRASSGFMDTAFHSFSKQWPGHPSIDVMAMALRRLTDALSVAPQKDAGGLSSTETEEER